MALTPSQEKAKKAEQQVRVEKMSDFNESAWGQLTYGAANLATSTLSAADKTDYVPGMQEAKQGIISTLKMIPGYGQAISAGLSLLDSIGGATGTNIDGISKEQAAAAGISGAGRAFNNILGSLPGTFLGGMVGDTRTAINSADVVELADAYSNTASDINMAGTMGGKSYLFGKKKANKFIDDANADVALLTAMNQTESIYKKATGEIYQEQANALYGGDVGNYTPIGKQGMKLPSKEEFIIGRADECYIGVYKEGGVIGIDTNILPEGALHRELNDLEDINKEIGEEVTSKGIPVIVTNEDGDIQQVAEIEREEIILRLEVTKKLEELLEDGSEEAMIEAGKLLVKEIITNTQDNTGQLEDANDGTIKS